MSGSVHVVAHPVLQHNLTQMRRRETQPPAFRVLMSDAGATSVRLIAIIAAPEGVANIERNHPDVQIVVAAIDRGLNEKGYIVPGLGDAGDRLYGTL